MGSYDFHITHHARERFVERFSRESVHFAHLSRCRKGCDLCHELTFWLLDLVKNHKDRWDKIICAKLHDAEDIRIYNNDTNFMEYMYNRYGYGRYKFMVESRILFVVTEANESVVLTCMDVNKPVNGSRVIADFVHRPKYNRRAI